MTALRAEPDSLLVAEVFGPTFQGEGVSTGRVAGFLRLGMCNLTCTWCDTPYTWDWERHDPAAELRRMDLDAVAAAVARLGVPMLVVTGGEPLMQQQALAALFERLPAALEIEVETNGTIAPSPAVTGRVARFNVSPKLANSHVVAGKRHKRAALTALCDSGKAIFKFVASNAGDLDEAAELVAEHAPRAVYVMPEGRGADGILATARELAEPALARGWNLSTRLHVLLWQDMRGV